MKITSQNLETTVVERGRLRWVQQTLLSPPSTSSSPSPQSGNESKNEEKKKTFSSFGERDGFCANSRREDSSLMCKTRIFVRSVSYVLF